MQKPVKESKSAATIRRRRLRNQSLLDTHQRLKATQQVEENLDLEDEELDMSCLEAVHGPRVLWLIMSSQKTLFLGLLAFRIVNALMIQTAFVPDEYWQSLEVSHNMAFGYGYLTWEWLNGLRGYSYPLIFSTLYKIMACLHLDNRILLIKLPRLIQAVFAALCDLYIYKLSLKLCGLRVARWTLFCQLTSWFTFYCASRTLTNSMETSLTTIALFYFPWPGKPRKAHWKYLVLAGLSIVVRPTAAIVWAPLFLYHLFCYRHVAFKVIKLMAEFGFLVLAVSSAIDRFCYGQWVYVHYNFMQFNVFSGLGTFYGSHPWHWYLTQGLPVILGVQLIPFLLAVCKGMDKPLVAIIAWTTAVYSCLGHKEFRFLFPILPLAMHLSGRYLAVLNGDTSYTPDMYCYDSDTEEEEEMIDNVANVNDKTHCPQNETLESSDSLPYAIAASLPCSVGKFLVGVLIVINLPLALYTCLIHQRGTVDVMRFLYTEAHRAPHINMSVLQLMPCHSTPYYSYLHVNISMRFLTCHPNLSGVENYVDEADVFYHDPSLWLNTSFTPSEEANCNTEPALPSHIIMFNALQSDVKPFLDKWKYKECVRLFHTHSPEGRVGSHVIAMCHHSWSDAIYQKRLHDQKMSFFNSR